MKYRRLGSAGVKVSEISLGTWLTYGCGVGDDTAARCVKTAFDQGINFFDSADVYNRGQSEEVLGNSIRELRRRDLVIATKCFFPMSDNINDRGLSRKHIMESCDESLMRLQTDYLDLYQCHRYDSEVEMPEVVRAMDDLIRQGKILYWGVSEWPAEMIRLAHAVAKSCNAYAPVSNQPEYSIAARRVETNGVQAACGENGMGMIVWSPLKQGLLTGKYAGGKVPADSRAANDKMNAFLKTPDAKIVERVEKLRPIAARHGCTLAQLALAWLRKRDAMSSIIIGATRPEQIAENVKATDVELTADDMAGIDTLFPAVEFQ